MSGFHRPAPSEKRLEALGEGRGGRGRQHNASMRTLPCYDESEKTKKKFSCVRVLLTSTSAAVEGALPNAILIIPGDHNEQGLR